MAGGRVGESYRVTTGDGRSTEELVEAGGYAYSHSCVISENFPARHFGGQRVREIALVEFDGEVTGLIGAGAFVAFGEGQEGMLPVRRLRGDWWELNEQGTILQGTRGGGAIRLGDPVRVRVRQVDAPRGRVDLDLAEALD